MNAEALLLIFAILAGLLCAVEIYAIRGRQKHMELLREYLEKTKEQP